jgi:hypothetical protein
MVLLSSVIRRKAQMMTMPTMMMPMMILMAKILHQYSNSRLLLSKNNRRQEYDMATGSGVPTGWYNKSRRQPPPANYRSVDAPHAPPDGKWHDAQRHYDMHYRDGMFREAYARAKVNGEFDYQSPLVKGFEFESTQDRKSRYGQNSYFKNPYSTTDQGPPLEYIYKESNMTEAKTVLKRKKGAVDKLHERWVERQEQQKGDKAVPIVSGQRMY